MVRRFAFVCVLALAAAAPATAREPQPDHTADLIHKLFAQKVVFDPGTNINDLPLIELLNYVSRKYELTFSINTSSFQAADVADIGERRPSLVITSFSGLYLHQFLNQVLRGMGATYLLRDDLVEIVALPYAAKISKNSLETDVNGTVLLKEPIVNAIVKNEKLADVLDLLAVRYNLSLSVSQLARDGASTTISTRLLNLPADKALDLLAAQCDLRVVREGNAFLITTRENAKVLLAERAEADMQKLELRKLEPRNPQPNDPSPVKPGPARRD
jgi:hypothetical protein